MSSSQLDNFLVSCADVLTIFDVKITAASVGSDGDTPLHVALWQSKTEMVPLLIEAGADVNAAGDMSETPLHVAVRKQNPSAVKALLKAGAKMHQLSEFGQSPKGMAEEIGGDIAGLFSQN